MIFSPPLPQKKNSEGALSSLRAATATHFSWPLIAPPFFIPCAPARWRVLVPLRFVRGTASIQSRFRFYRLARRSLRQAARRTGRWRHRCCNAVAKIRHACSRARCRPLSRTCGELATLSINRHHEPKGAAAEPSQSRANLGQWGQIGAGVGVKSTRPPNSKSLDRVPPLPRPVGKRAGRLLVDEQNEIQRSLCAFKSHVRSRATRLAKLLSG